MNKKTPIKTILFLILTVGLFGAAKAQSGSIQFSSGVTVAIKTETVPPNDKNSMGNYFSSGTGYTENTVHRVLTDAKNKIYFGYDLTFEKLGESGNFKVFIKPLSKSPNEIFNRKSVASVGNVPDYDTFAAKSLAKYPEAFVLEDGDAATLDILENRQTGAKVSDVIKITAKPQKFGTYFSERENARDFTINDVNLYLDKPEISVDGRKTAHGSRVSGNVIWFYIPGKGRFIFSFRPQPEFDFQKTGVILDNKIVFEHGGEKYEIVNESSVLNSGGKWNLWVMFDPKFQTANSGSSSYTFGAADEVKALFDHR